MVLIIVLSILVYLGVAFGTIRFCSWFFDDAARYVGTIIGLGIFWPLFWLLFVLLESMDLIEGLAPWDKIGKKIVGIK